MQVCGVLMVEWAVCVLCVISEVATMKVMEKQAAAAATAAEAVATLAHVEAEYEEATKATEALKQQEVELNNQIDDVTLSIKTRKARVRALACSPVGSDA